MKVTSLELSPEAMMKMGEFVIRVCILSFRTHQPEVEEALARGYAEGGYRRAMSSAAEALEARSGTTYVLPWEIAELYVLAGKNDRALEWIERSVEVRDPNIVYIGVFPEFESLWDDPRFKDLLRRMNLPEQE